MTRSALPLLASAVIVAGAFAAAAPAAAAPTRLAAVQDTGRVVVTGTARVSVPSDRARVRFAVETEAETAAEAVAGNAERMDRAMAALREALDEGGTLETSGYSLSPVYRQPPRDEGGEPRIAAYRALNHIVVMTEDPPRVGALLDAAVEAGVNRVAGISFFAEDTRAARLEALRQATERAREEAAVLAEALGAELGPPLEVHTSQDMPSPRDQLMLRGAAQEMGTPVEPGEQDVVVNVTITYRLGGG